MQSSGKTAARQSVEPGAAAEVAEAAEADAEADADAIVPEDPDSVADDPYGHEADASDHGEADEHKEGSDGDDDADLDFEPMGGIWDDDEDNEKAHLDAEFAEFHADGQVDVSSFTNFVSFCCS